MDDNINRDCINWMLNYDERMRCWNLYGVIDIGSNTIRLMVYKVEHGSIRPLLNKKSVAGLAGYVGKSGRLKKAGIQKAISVLQEFREILDHIDVEEVFPFATASLRNIENTDEVLSAIRAESGFSVRVLSGTEEAVFDYYGAIHSVDLENGLLVDIGGGSTELVFYQEREVVSTASLPIGSLNLYNRFVAGILPTGRESAQIASETLRQLQTVHLPAYPISFQSLCGVGGTARTIRKLLENQKALSREEAAYPCEALGVLLRQLTKDTQGTAKQVLKIEPERIHTLFPGVIILNTVASYYGSRSVVTSKYGVREGYLYYLLEDRGLLGE